METIKLSKNQEIKDIRLEVADNGGVVLKYCIYTPAIAKKESNWDDKVEIYSLPDDAYPRITELYKADIGNKMSSNGTKKKTGSDTPVKASY